MASEHGREFPNESQRRLKWERMADDWKKAEAPAIPSVGDVEIFRECLRRALDESDNRAVIILGATWRLREIFLDRQFEGLALYCVDWSKKMYEVNTQILGKIPKNETYVQESWSRYRIENRVGAIIGDKIIDNLPFREWPTFFECSAKHLSPNGRLILHCAPIIDTPNAGATPIDYLKKWAVSRVHDNLSVEEAASGFWEDLLTSSAAIGDVEARVLCIGKYKDQLDLLEPKDPEEAAILSCFYKIFGPAIGDAWCAYSMRDIEAQASNSFDLSEIHYAADYQAAKEQPIVALKRR